MRGIEWILSIVYGCTAIHRRWIKVSWTMKYPWTFLTSRRYVRREGFEVERGAHRFLETENYGLKGSRRLQDDGGVLDCGVVKEKNAESRVLLWGWDDFGIAWWSGRAWLRCEAHNPQPTGVKLEERTGCAHGPPCAPPQSNAKIWSGHITRHSPRPRPQLLLSKKVQNRDDSNLSFYSLFNPITRNP